MRYTIVDSHRTMNRKKKEELASFFAQVKQIPLEKAYDQVDFCNWFEKEFAVSWFEVIVYDRQKAVGYLRCLRNPEKLVEWFIGDVHVIASYQQKGIATKMYEKAVDTVKEYEAAEYIVSSVHCKNRNSIGLHEKTGFYDTKKPCEFPNFYFDEKETAYKKWIYQYYPVMDVEMAMEMLLPLWIKYEKKHSLTTLDENLAAQKLMDILQKTVKEKSDTIRTIWCGNRLVGFIFEDDGYIEND